MLNHINKEINIDCIETEIFITELCSKISGLKLLDKTRVTEHFEGYFSPKGLPAPDGEHEDEWDAKHEQIGYKLTFNGLTNAVVWTSCQDKKAYGTTSSKRGNTIKKITTYYYHVPENIIKQIGDKHTIKSVSIRNLITKIIKNNSYPVSDMVLFGGGGRGNVLEGLYKKVINDESIRKNYNEVSCSSKSYHELLAMVVSHETIKDNSIYRKDLDKFIRLQNQIENKTEECKKLLSKPITIIVRDNLMVKNQGVVITGDLSTESRDSYSALNKLYSFNSDLFMSYSINVERYIVLQNIEVKFFENIVDFDDVASNDTLGRLSMHRMTIQDKFSKLMVGNLMPYQGKYESDADEYDNALRIFYKHVARYDSSNRVSHRMLVMLESQDKLI